MRFWRAILIVALFAGDAASADAGFPGGGRAHHFYRNGLHHRIHGTGGDWHRLPGPNGAAALAAEPEPIGRRPGDAPDVKEIPILGEAKEVPIFGAPKEIPLR